LKLIPLSFSKIKILFRKWLELEYLLNISEPIYAMKTMKQHATDDERHDDIQKLSLYDKKLGDRK